jgi:L-threonylcarbamoyladenylate synthase
VAFPTETVYGLGANALKALAVARIFEAKGRPRFNPLIVHVASLDDARAFGEFTAEAEALARAFWPGPLTLVLPHREGTGLSDLVSAGLPTVALRVPAHEGARALIAAAGVPVAAPSANRSGRVSATTAAHVEGDFGAEVDMILDGGPCTAGIESSIVALTEGAAPVLLRAGGVASDSLEDVLGRPLSLPGDGGDGKSSKPQAPGMLTSHYAPRADMRLNADAPLPGEAFLAFGPASAILNMASNAAFLNLSENGDLREAAANLFAHLRALDASGASQIAVAPVPNDGLGEAINDRLRRAAAPRE